MPIGDDEDVDEMVEDDADIDEMVEDDEDVDETVEDDADIDETVEDDVCEISTVEQKEEIYKWINIDIVEKIVFPELFEAIDKKTREKTPPPFKIKMRTTRAFVLPDGTVEHRPIIHH